MLLAFIICHLSVFVAANPFHKYPFVFLLDVGNEELEKTNSEQIRVSVPGGSIALRYPAIGYGSTIGHIRVSGIDFGTDLKASIVDGGPGYKYVVLVFMGKPGTPYDAVMTVQTVVNDNLNNRNAANVVNSESNTYENEEDKNDSAEDLSDTEVSNNVQSETYVQNSNAELMQSSSNMYSYINNESNNENEDDKDDTEYSNEELVSGEESIEKSDFEDVNNAQDIHEQYADDIENEDSKTSLEEDDDNVGNDDDEINVQSEEQQPEMIDKNSFADYGNIQEHSNFDNEIYSGEEYQKSSNYQEDPLDYVDPYAEEMGDVADKYKDFNNNNYVDVDDSYAVAY